MPLFPRHRVLFIHIPKCGGDTISHALGLADDPPFLFVADGSVMVNRHTPQHMTWREFLAAGWRTPEGFRVAALVRHPVDRVISAFRYVRLYRPDLQPLAPDPASFLEAFLSPQREVFERFDQHNRGLMEFLAGRDGVPDPSILVRPVQEMDAWLKELGLPAIPSSGRRNVTRGRAEFEPFGADELARIRAHYADDIAWFEGRFPHCRPELAA